MAISGNYIVHQVFWNAFRNRIQRTLSLHPGEPYPEITCIELVADGMRVTEARPPALGGTRTYHITITEEIP